MAARASTTRKTAPRRLTIRSSFRATMPSSTASCSASFFGDNGITGTMMERPGLQAALASLKAGKAQVLVIEDVDRLGRDQEHLSDMRKLFVAYGVTIPTVAAGQIDDLVFAFKGIVGEQQRARIAYRTCRSLKGKATCGGSTRGKMLRYGWRCWASTHRVVRSTAWRSVLMKLNSCCASSGFTPTATASKGSAISSLRMACRHRGRARAANTMPASSIRQPYPVTSISAKAS